MFKSIIIRSFLGLTLWCLVISAVGAAYFWQWLTTAAPIHSDHRIMFIEKGQGVGSIAHQLHQEKILRWPLVWRLYARFIQPGTVKAGEYALNASESPVSLLTLLQGGEVVHYNITLVEGLTLQDWLIVMAGEGKLKPLASNMSPSDIAEYLGIKQENPEGWFFPDTYRFEKGDSDLDVLKRAHTKMKAELSQQWSRRQPALPFSTPYEALILASIIEKETGVPYERGAISGVFNRRLKKNMRLQTDPTVIYGMGEHYNGNITRADLKRPTPYNTYVIKGLPPTPIANPGKQALAAAVSPEKGEALYFVAKGDGSHYFSKTLDEHNKAVRQYQLNRRADYRSTLDAKKQN